MVLTAGGLISLGSRRRSSSRSLRAPQCGLFFLRPTIKASSWGGSWLA
jgi:hypothetical protein